ncbi:hypothetical protein EDB84DRAFT_1434122 [Lactarius hengduanensis]|nr:hypothetical protein EDB84DRAFT_1434122 [Lactarius hengduanensis]
MGNPRVIVSQPGVQRSGKPRGVTEVVASQGRVGVVASQGRVGVVALQCRVGVVALQRRVAVVALQCRVAAVALQRSVAVVALQRRLALVVLWWWLGIVESRRCCRRSNVVAGLARHVGVVESRRGMVALARHKNLRAKVVMAATGLRAARWWQRQEP